jgi:hypothetical protein
MGVVGESVSVVSDDPGDYQELPWRGSDEDEEFCDNCDEPIDDCTCGDDIDDEPEESYL